MDGFKRPTNRPQSQRPVPPTSPQVSQQTDEQRASGLPAAGIPAVTPPEPAAEMTSAPVALSLKKSKRRRLAAVVLAVAATALGIGLFLLWFQARMQPVNYSDHSVQRVEIKEGSSLSFVAGRLEERGIIRSSLAFKLLANLKGKQGAVKAGTCNLNPAYSAQEVLDKITGGCHDFISVTFYPGATLETSLYAKTKAEKENKEFKDMSIRASLLAAGFDDAEITKAFRATYDSPLFAGKPAGEGYEGYVFGETYFVDEGATAEDVLKTAFDHMNEIIEENALAAKFKGQGLSVYEGITLASIVGRELDCEGKPTKERKETCYQYQRQIAGVFYNRLERGMTLGSDVTSIYASDKLKKESSVTIDSPYNTRKYPGLPPGPIATPGELALLSVGDPVKSDDLYFLAGDDGLIYFAKDEAGHQANITNHCKLLCGDL